MVSLSHRGVQSPLQAHVCGRGREQCAVLAVSAARRYIAGSVLARRAVKEGGAEVPALDTRASQGKLFIPKRDMVSHGDANLQIDAFLAAIPG